MMLYHGSNVIVQEPQILENGFYKDFGYGFYCTIIEKQAKRWALTKRRKHIVNFYEYSPDKGLNIKKFSEMTEEWLQFVVNCRLGLKHDYDIVEGPMADDQSGIMLRIIWLNEFQKRLSGNWLSLSIRHIRLYSAQRKHYRLSNLKGVIRYDKQIFPGRAGDRERSLFSMLYGGAGGKKITSKE